MSNSFAYIETPDQSGFTFITLDTMQSFTVYRTDIADYEGFRDSVISDEISTEEAIRIVTAKPEFARKVESGDYAGVQILGGRLHFQGQPVQNALATRILDLVDRGLPVDPWIRFAEKVYRNPRSWVPNELDLWLAKSNLPITADGDFLAYKRIRGNYKDCHTNTMDNSPGRVVSVPEEVVDTNRNNTCSTGLHFCSNSYLPSFGNHAGNRTVIVKVNPEHVVSIPSDYDNAKGRTWRYEVLSEITHDAAMNREWEPVYHDERKARDQRVRKPRVVNIAGVGKWEDGKGVLFESGASVETFGKAEDGRYIVSFDIDSDNFDAQNIVDVFERSILDVDVYDDDSAAVTFEASSVSNALLRAFHIVSMDHRTPELSCTDHGVKYLGLSTQAEQVARYIRNEFGFLATVDYRDNTLWIQRRSHSKNDLNWKQAVRLLDHLALIDQQTKYDLQAYRTHLDGTTTTISLHGDVIGIALLHPSDLSIANDAVGRRVAFDNQTRH